MTVQPRLEREARPWVWWGLACLAAALPYLRTIPDYFVQDDFGVVQLLAGKPWDTFPRWFVMPWMEDIWGYTPDEIRPFPALSYQLTALWGAGAPEGHHLANILIHAVNAVLVLQVAHRAARIGLPAAAAAAAIFAVLPVQAESVAWITGRVDSFPALFYLASFYCYVRWRQLGAPRLYTWSLAWFFVALFSKQNTITMVATMAAYDIVVERRSLRPVGRAIAPYVPVVLMTIAFLVLRLLVVGEALREGHLATIRVEPIAQMVARHLGRIVVGGPAAAAWWAWLPAVLFAAALLVPVTSRAHDVPSRWRSILYFGPIWVAIGLAPVALAGYESPRHAYLASAGWAICLGIAIDRLAGSRAHDRAAWTARAAALAVVACYLAVLWPIVSSWRTRALVAERAAAALHDELLGAAPGTLVIASAPVSSWEWAFPFVAERPFRKHDPRGRAFIVSPMLLDCCGLKWFDTTRETLRQWQAHGGGPIVSFHVASLTAERSRVTDRDRPELRALVHALPQIRTAEALDGAIVRILQDLVAVGAPRGDFRK